MSALRGLLAYIQERPFMLPVSIKLVCGHCIAQSCMLIFVLLRFSASSHTQGCDDDSGERPTGRTAESAGASGGAGEALPGQTVLASCTSIRV